MSALPAPLLLIDSCTLIKNAWAQHCPQDCVCHMKLADGEREQRGSFKVQRHSEQDTARKGLKMSARVSVCVRVGAGGGVGSSRSRETHEKIVSKNNQPPLC